MPRARSRDDQQPHGVDRRDRGTGHTQATLRGRAHHRQPVCRQGIREWMPNWKRQGWQRKEGGRFKPVMNADSGRGSTNYSPSHEVHVTHVLGHRGHPENEACDRMAVAAYKALGARKRKPS